MRGTRTASFFSEGDPKHGGREAAYSGSLVGKEGFAKVTYFGGSSQASNLKSDEFCR